MNQSLESALIIALKDQVDWSAALPPVDQTSGTLTAVDPGLPFDVLSYARRDREFQHRDMVNAAAIAKVSIHARTVWSGTVVQPRLPGITAVTDQSGTNVVLPLDPSQVGDVLPNSSSAVTYVLNSDVPYAAVQVTDVNLYNRDLLIYETLARAAALFTDSPPINEIDPSGTYIGSTAIWATAQGTDTPSVPNAAQPLDQALLKNPDLYLAERDNQVVAYASRVVQALKNPFDYATRIYVKVTAPDAGESSESETYVLTDNAFITGYTYTAGDQVIYGGAWYEALNTTTDTPPSSSWSALSGPTKLQFMAEPALDSRNRIVYDTEARTLQWFRETLDLIHVPQIVGFYVPGIFPGQAVQTVPQVPEAKDAQFWRQKAARVNFSEGTWSSQLNISPTATSGTDVSTITGGINVLFDSAKAVALMMPDSLTMNFGGLNCSAGTYAVNCLVRPSPTVEIAGGDNQQGSVVEDDGGTTFSAIGDARNWQVPLPAGGWKLFIEFSNVSATQTSSFGIKASQGATPILANTLPLYYTDSDGNALPTGTLVTSPGIDLQSTGQDYNFSIRWTSGSGQLHISKLIFQQVDGPATSHYIMSASWHQSQGTNISYLDVIGAANMPDVMPFQFYVADPGTIPSVTVNWLPKSGSLWVAKSYNPGDQVLYNLKYWQATAITASTDVPGESSLWTQLGSEPQVPLVFEQVQLAKFVEATTTPQVVGFQGFRQDMLERALRADEDAYSRALIAAGTNLPEFRSFGSIWTIDSTGSWMQFSEIYQPRLRQVPNVTSGNIAQNRQYAAITQGTGVVVYAAGSYSNGQTFYGVAGTSTYAVGGMASVNQVGAYRISEPGDLGKTGLVPAGLEFVTTNGTVAAWYPAYASYPTHQAIQPWMIERGFYVADNDFDSPSGMPTPIPSPQNLPA